MSNSLRPHRLHSPWNSPGQNTGAGNRSLLQGIFPTQGSNLGLPHCRWSLYQLSHKGSLRILEWVAYPFSSRSSRPRNRTEKRLFQWFSPKFPNLQASLEGNTHVPRTTSFEPLLPSWLQQECRFSCFVWKGFPAFPAHLRMRLVSRRNSRLALCVVPHAEWPRFPGPLLRRTRCLDTSLKATLWAKAQHKGALTPPRIIRKNPQVPHTARRGAWDPLINSRGKRSSLPQTRWGLTLLSQLCRDPEVGVWNGVEAWGSCLPLRWGPLPLRQAQRSPERLRQLHSIPHLSEAPWEVP